MRLIKGRTFYMEPWYGSYHSMMDRCYREKANNYPSYGGRGIKVCVEWHNIETFEKWVQKSGYKKGLSLERKDPNKGYSPDNCKWATAKEQANNRRNTLFLEFNGEKHSVGEWAQILETSRSTIANRYYRGLPMEKVLTKGMIANATPNRC